MTPEPTPARIATRMREEALQAPAAVRRMLNADVGLYAALAADLRQAHRS